MNPENKAELIRAAKEIQAEGAKDVCGLPTFFWVLPKIRRVLGIEAQTARARHPNLKPAETRPLSRMGTE